MANPILVSSGVTVTAASIVPAVEWALNGFHGGVPESVASLLAGVLVAVVHAGLNWLNNRSTPTQTPPAA
ncbi:hypothetical protein [Castellaniella sp. UC4442_H9]